MGRDQQGWLPADRDVKSRPGFPGIIFIGINDGLILPFAISAAVCKYTGNNSTVAIITAVFILGAAVLLGLGGYLARKEEQEMFPVNNHTGGSDSIPWHETELKETESRLINLGIGEDIREKAGLEISEEHDRWGLLVSNYELYRESGVGSSPQKTAITIFLSYLTGGFITLLPYIALDDSKAALKLSCWLAFPCLLISGFFKGRVSGMSPTASALRMLIIGFSAAALGYIVVEILEKM